MGADPSSEDLPSAALEAIRKIEREKDEFLSLVTHELKTPLTPLKSVAQLIRLRMRKARQGDRPLDLEALEQNLATIERQVDRMDRLVTDILEVSRIGRGTFVLRRAPFDLALVARDVARRNAEMASGDGRHTFDVQAPASLEVNGDQQRIDQVLMSLVGNALKFSPRGGTIRIGVEACDGEAAVTVRDDGIGIPADELPRMGREAYVRGRAAKGYAGLGIGLYLARLIAEAHGGRVDVESAGADQGTTARLTLPR